MYFSYGSTGFVKGKKNKFIPSIMWYVKDYQKPFISKSVLKYNPFLGVPLL